MWQGAVRVEVDGEEGGGLTWQLAASYPPAEVVFERVECCSAPQWRPLMAAWGSLLVWHPKRNRFQPLSAGMGVGGGVGEGVRTRLDSVLSGNGKWEESAWPDG